MSGNALENGGLMSSRCRSSIQNLQEVSRHRRRNLRNDSAARQMNLDTLQPRMLPHVGMNGTQGVEPYGPTYTPSRSPCQFMQATVFQ